MDGDPAAPRISAASIRAFAESLGVAGLAEDVAAAQAADVEYRLRQIVQARPAGGLRGAAVRAERAARRLHACSARARGDGG